VSERAFRNLVLAVIFATTILTIVAAGLQADASRVAAAASIAVAGATLLLALVTYKAVTEGRQASQQNQRALARPLLVPTNPIDQGDLANAKERAIDVDNVGTGVALNIHGVLMPVSHPVAGLPQQLSVQYPFPLRPKEVKPIQFTQGGTMFGPDDRVAGVPMSVPADLEPDEGIPDTMDRKDRVVARLTLTYQDLFSQIHSSVFDLTKQNQWVAVAIKDGIEAGIREIDEQKTLPRKPRRSLPGA
jgi:hypothetical protein